MALDNIKTATIWKRRGGAGTKGYSNSWNFHSLGGVSDPQTIAFALKIATAERTLASNKVFFDRVVISTYATKEALGTADKPKVVPLSAYGQIDFMQGIVDPTEAHLLPPEACLIVATEGDVGKLGLHPLRHSIPPLAWTNDGSGVQLKPYLLTAADGAFGGLTYVDEQTPYLVTVGEGVGGEPAFPVLSVRGKGYGLKQLTQKRGKSNDGDAFTLGKTKEEDATEMLGQALEVVSETNANPYNTPAARLFTDPKVLGMIGSLIAAGTAFKARRDAGDFGPLPVG